MASSPETNSAEWGIDQLDIEAYMQRLGLQRPMEPTTEALFALHRAHVTAIPFENLDPLLDRSPSVELGAITDKLVGSRRGGYCFEHGLLFAAALERLGFGVERLLGRIRMGTSQIQPRTHMLLRVRSDDGGEAGVHLADVGLGDLRPVLPLPFEDGISADQRGWTYALVSQADGQWVVRRQIAEEWQDLYSFELERQHPTDFRMANHFAATYPHSPFRQGLFLAYTEATRRLALHGWQLTDSTAAGSETRTVEPDELGELLADRFGIVLATSDLAELRRRLREQG